MFRRKKKEERSLQTWQVPDYKGLWKINLTYWKQKTTRSVLTDAVCIVHLLCNVPGWGKKLLESTTSKTRGSGCGKDKQMVTYGLLFNFSHCCSSSAYPQNYQA